MHSTNLKFKDEQCLEMKDYLLLCTLLRLQNTDNMLSVGFFRFYSNDGFFHLFFYCVVQMLIKHIDNQITQNKSIGKPFNL